MSPANRNIAKMITIDNLKIVVNDILFYLGENSFMMATTLKKSEWPHINSRSLDKMKTV